MEPLIPTYCHKCNVTSEAKLSNAGPHIKRTCIHCGTYIDFYTKSAIPDTLTTKLRIWKLTGEDMEWINRIKIEMDFPSNPTGLMGKLLYWWLYCRILKELDYAPLQRTTHETT